VGNISRKNPLLRTTHKGDSYKNVKRTVSSPGTENSGGGLRTGRKTRGEEKFVRRFTSRGQIVCASKDSFFRGDIKRDVQVGSRNWKKKKRSSRVGGEGLSSCERRSVANLDSGRSGVGIPEGRRRARNASREETFAIPSQELCRPPKKGGPEDDLGRGRREEGKSRSKGVGKGKIIIGERERKNSLEAYVILAKGRRRRGGKRGFIGRPGSIS